MNSAKQHPRLATEGVEGNRQHIQLCNPITPIKLAASIEPLLTKADLAEILRVNTRTIERMISRGDLPKPDKHLSRMPRWRAETIRRWIEFGGGQ
jgi:predicted DNA-binding transcriptional regulator AlpA